MATDEKPNRFNFKTAAVLFFQLIIIILLAAFGTNYVKKLADNSALIIKDNLRSVEYCEVMRHSLNALRINPNQLPARMDFENNLQYELKNITETGEKDLADKVQSDYFQYLKTPNEGLYNQLVDNIGVINRLNISAIERKNLWAQQAASSATSSIAIISILSGVVAFLFTFLFIGRLFQSKDIH